jgi:hypothetical protein
MRQEQTSTESAAPFLMKQFADLGQETFYRMMTLQKGLLKTVQELNQQWAASMSAEAELASQFFAKLTAAKSMPDAASACQECGSRQMEILADQNRKLMAASERIMPQMFGNGLKGGGT